jgi:hypothetical protein
MSNDRAHRKHDIHDRYDQWLADGARCTTKTQLAINQARAVDLLTEAMGRLRAARRSLLEATNSWAEGPCPGFTCNEATGVYEALLALLADNEEADGFMAAHAATDDDPADIHVVDDSVDGVGWFERDPWTHELEPEDVPCSTCSRTDLDLHVNGQCPECNPDGTTDGMPLFEVVSILTYDGDTDSLDPF